MTTEDGRRGQVEQLGKAALDRGTKLGKYGIERLIGVGSMGAVYEGVHRETGKRFAIKVLSPALAAAPAARARFLKEARLTAGLRHPNIVDVTDVGEDGGHSYLVMELLEGEDLSQRLRRSGPLSAAWAADILRPVCNAVAEAHRRGITHRDLKPSNIFLAIREGRLHPVILDFGIAMDGDGASPADPAGAVSTKRAVLGTPYYLAPEQVADHQVASAASDQHALGVILYECLTGKPPYGGDTLEEVLRAIVAGNPAPPSTRRSDVPQSLDAVVRRALNSDPKRRFASVAELGLGLYPFASKGAGAKPEPYRRPPTSPAIDVEASTPSPFVRTLTPEVEALDGAWFAAGETPHEITGEVVMPSPIEADAAVEAEPPLPTDLPQAFENAASGKGKRAFRRLWIGAAGGVALASLALVLVVTRGSASGPPVPPPAAQALVEIAPARVVVEEPPVEPMPAAAAVRAPAPAPSEPLPAAPTAAAPTAAAPSEEPTPAPPAPAPSAPAPSEALAATVPAPAPREPLAPAPSVAPAPAPTELPAPAPSARPTPAPSELAAAVPAPAEPPAPADVPAAAEKSRARKSVEKPRARAGGVRMKNGVPLLD